MSLLDWLTRETRDEQLRRESLDRLVNPPRRSLDDVPPSRDVPATVRADRWAQHLATTKPVPRVERLPVPVWFHSRKGIMA